MNDEEAIEELKILQRAFGFNGEKGTSEYYYLRDEEPENYKTALAIETVLNLIEKKDKIIDLMAKELAKVNYLQYCNTSNCDYPPCNKEKCIKEYFENKVKESK